MRSILIAVVGSLALAAMPDAYQCRWAATATSSPAIGDAAPDFSLIGSDGRTYRLSDYQGKQAVVLTWFAKAFTSG